VRQRLPAIIISAHVYSKNPRQRSIVVNNDFMEEGEYFLDGIILDEITPDGAIFLYRDMKFHMGVVSGWQ
jgi:general secretion pathway protein B